MNWSDWLYWNREALAGGAKLVAPYWLGSPSTAGFRLVTSAAYEGQTRNWALSQRDGSRIHVHEYSDGRCVAHRDTHDPDRGLADMVAHLAFDTPLGLIALATSAVWLMSQQEG
jgi:hypothetical protein